MRQRGKIIEGDLETQHSDDAKIIIEIDHSRLGDRLGKILACLQDISKEDPTAFVSVRCSEFDPVLEQDEPKMIWGLKDEKDMCSRH